MLLSKIVGAAYDVDKRERERESDRVGAGGYWLGGGTRIRE